MEGGEGRRAFDDATFPEGEEGSQQSPASGGRRPCYGGRERTDVRAAKERRGGQEALKKGMNERTKERGDEEQGRKRERKEDKRERKEVKKKTTKYKSEGREIMEEGRDKRQ